MKKAPPPRDKGPPKAFNDAMRGRGSSMDDVTGEEHGEVSGAAGSAAASDEY